MKINAIGVTTFGRNQQIVKRAAAGLTAAIGASLAADHFVKASSRPDTADHFVKGVSKPDAVKENDILKGNDEGWNPVDPCCDAACDTPEEQREECC